MHLYDFFFSSSSSCVSQRVKFATGLFDRPANMTIPSTPQLVTPAMVGTARDAAAQSITLLINKQMKQTASAGASAAGASAALPIFLGSIKSMLLAGPLIDAIDSQQGGYSHKSPDTHPTITIKTSALAAARRYGFQLTTSLGTSNSSHAEPVVANDAAVIDAAVEAAAAVDVAVLVLGDSLKTCGEMKDRSSLELLGGQPDLLRRVAAVAKKTIVILIGGRPLTFGEGLCTTTIDPESSSVASAFPWDPSERAGAVCSTPSLLQNVSTLLTAWRPGAQGGPAVFDLLSWAANPSGHLPVAW